MFWHFFFVLTDYYSSAAAITSTLVYCCHKLISRSLSLDLSSLQKEQKWWTAIPVYPSAFQMAGKLPIARSTISLLQMATYWFVIGWFDNQSAQKSKVRQVAKDVVKSKVYPQTYSP